MNCAAIHKLSLIFLLSFEKHTSQSLLMPYVIVLEPMSQPISPLIGNSMFWMAGHFFKALHGLVELCTKTYYTSIHYLKKYWDALVVFNRYDSTNTKYMAHLRRSKGNVGITVTFTDNMTLTMKKELFLSISKKQNKQRLISMLSEELQNNFSDP